MDRIIYSTVFLTFLDVEEESKDFLLANFAPSPRQSSLFGT
jgi:hypothetical protein